MKQNCNVVVINMLLYFIQFLSYFELKIHPVYLNLFQAMSMQCIFHRCTGTVLYTGIKIIYSEVIHLFNFLMFFFTK